MTRADFGYSILSIYRALETYASAHKAEYETPISEDYVLGVAWLDILKGCRALLNGDTGKADPGAMDAMLVGLARDVGFKDEEL